MKLLSENEVMSLHSANGFAKVEEALRTRASVFEQAMCRLPINDNLLVEYAEYRAKMSELQNIMQILDITR